MSLASSTVPELEGKSETNLFIIRFNFETLCGSLWRLFENHKLHKKDILYLFNYGRK